jgi:hypothetical protein
MGRLTGERKALASAFLAFYGLLFLVVAMAPPPGWQTCFAALAGIYGLGFFALVAGYFWARWYAIGLGMSGLISGVISCWQVGLEPILVFYGLSHGAVSLLLWGGAMAGGFDGKKDWRERFHLDENGTHRLGKSVIRLGISLPYVVMYGLAPREGSGAVLLAAGGLALVALGGYALVKMRTWGVLALAGGALGLAATAHVTPFAVSFSHGYAVQTGVLGVAAVTLLVMAVAPFAAPMVRYLRTGERV